jgi:hypothetical protein
VRTVLIEKDRAAATLGAPFDMIGNVVQSCWDIFDPGVYGSYRVFRGMRARREIASASGDCGGPTLDRNS